MKTKTNHMKLYFRSGTVPAKSILTLLLFFLLQQGYPQEAKVADTFDITMNSMRFPHQYKKWGFQIGAGLQLVRPPADLLENAIQAPLVNIHMTFGLPWRFSLEADVSTILVSNQIAIGPRIGYGFKNFYFNAGWDGAFVYGQLRQGGFDNSTRVFLQYPNLSLGYKLKKMAFTLKGEAVFVTRLIQTSGDKELTRSKDFYNGITVGFYLEQRLWKDSVFIFGIKDNYEKYYWPTWMIYTTFNRFYHIPELSFMWIL
jgi:hypothetical protein